MTKNLGVKKEKEEVMKIVHEVRCLFCIAGLELTPNIIYFVSDYSHSQTETVIVPEHH